MNDVPGTSPGSSSSGGGRLKAFAAGSFMVLGYTYVALLLLAGGALWWGGDRWWLATVLLFGPRWVFGVPLLVLIPGGLWLAPRVGAVLAIGLLVFLFPLLGMNLGIPRSSDADDLEIVTINVADGRRLLRPVPEIVATSGAHIVAVQECPRSVRAKAEVDGYEFHAHRGLCLFSRLPIRDVETDVEHDSVPGTTARYTLDHPSGRRISFTNLHLPTPRAGLEDIRGGDLATGIERLDRDTQVRARAATEARALVDGAKENPRIVVGDFNAPPESRIQRDAWGDFGNAFTLAGLGFGFTRYNGWIRARIDHVLFDQHWTVVSAGVSRDVGSDHRPVVVRLRLKP